MGALDELFPDLGVIGAGNMAGALLRGTVGRGLLSPDRVWACDIDPAKLEALSDDLAIQTTTDAVQVVCACRSIVLSVKPQVLLDVLDAIRGSITPEHRLISIAAGMTVARMMEHLPPRTRIVRVMPNTPVLVGYGAAGVAAGPHATPVDLTAALELFKAVGVAFQVDESDMDAVTALSGTGPAYIFRVMEIMMEAGVAMGLKPEVAIPLTYQTVLGAAHLACQSPEPPAELRRRVTSPGGTTEAAMKLWEERGFADVWKAGIFRARDRSRELAQG